jgi:hypothetical protein
VQYVSTKETSINVRIVVEAVSVVMERGRTYVKNVVEVQYVSTKETSINALNANGSRGEYYFESNAL